MKLIQIFLQGFSGSWSSTSRSHISKTFPSLKQMNFILKFFILFHTFRSSHLSPTTITISTTPASFRICEENVKRHNEALFICRERERQRESIKPPNHNIVHTIPLLSGASKMEWNNKKNRWKGNFVISILVSRTLPRAFLHIHPILFITHFRLKYIDSLIRILLPTTITVRSTFAN